MGFSVAGHSGQNHKTVDLSLKINFFQIFSVQIRIPRAIFTYPELEIKKCAQGQELLIFAAFLKNRPTMKWHDLWQNFRILNFKATSSLQNLFLFLR
jgi:hypothetical protein